MSHRWEVGATTPSARRISEVRCLRHFRLQVPSRLGKMCFAPSIYEPGAGSPRRASASLFTCATARPNLRGHSQLQEEPHLVDVSSSVAPFGALQGLAAVLQNASPELRRADRPRCLPIPRPAATPQLTWSLTCGLRSAKIAGPEGPGRR
ncbi:hypothetical protein NDU88_005585 [Pleurodeles waltl]|uniref:Uncharacterized protein n=1 Tax=Pleurodeles waltl TaxID=8319 RepID=A0AAV7W8G6_PLEWA|nr:hypothetical protein NDU88_005585 [Pleurodeles waltl]